MVSQSTAAGLSPEAIQQMTQIVQAAIAQHSRHHSGSQSPPPIRHPDEDGHLNTNRLRKNDIGFFNPDLRDQDERGTGIMTAPGEDTTYVCVYAFTDKLKQHVISHGEQQVKNVWTTCLRGAASQWYISFLSPVEQRMFRDTPVDDICEVLIQRWKPPLSEAMALLARARYTLSHAQQDESIETHAMKQLRDARTCGLSTRAQLQAVYNSLDPQIRALLPPPTCTDTPSQLVMALRDRWGTIRDLARHAYNRRGDRRGPSRHPNQDWQRSRSFATQGRSQRFSGPGYNNIINISRNTPPPGYDPLRALPQGPAAPPSGSFYGNSGTPNAKPTYDSGRNAFQNNNGYYNHNNNYNSNQYSGNNRFPSQSNPPQLQTVRIHHQDGGHIIEPDMGTEEPIDDWSEELCQHPEEMYDPDDYWGS
ncbi:hypothetical protein NHJ13734_009079 [Beauveria thailandica]